MNGFELVNDLDASVQILIHVVLKLRFITLCYVMLRSIVPHNITLCLFIYMF